MTLLITKNKDIYSLNHDVSLYVSNNDLMTLIKAVSNSNALHLNKTILLSNMGVEDNSSDIDFVNLVLAKRELNLNLFPLPCRKEYGYHARL